jgi:hypothetical protein
MGMASRSHERVDCLKRCRQTAACAPPKASMSLQQLHRLNQKMNSGPSM